ncbi:MAG: GPP34 family phosphoprotein [Mobilicoccus sp.]|nr:GPP34 family phosphoprotein [Mobilicoccus sp.]
MTHLPLVAELLLLLHDRRGRRVTTRTRARRGLVPTAVADLALLGVAEVEDGPEPRVRRIADTRPGEYAPLLAMHGALRDEPRPITHLGDRAVPVEEATRALLTRAGITRADRLTTAMRGRLPIENTPRVEELRRRIDNAVRSGRPDVRDAVLLGILHALDVVPVALVATTRDLGEREVCWRIAGMIDHPDLPAAETAIVQAVARATVLLGSGHTARWLLGGLE